MSREIRAQIQRFALGSSEIITFLDGSHVRDAINPPFAMNKSETEISEIASKNNVPSSRFENTYTPTLLNIRGKLVLIDTGFGQLLDDGKTGKLLELMGKSGYTADQIDFVAFTHCHPDHIGGFLTDGAPTFPNAQYLIGRLEFDGWLSGDGIPPQRKENRELFMKFIKPYAERFIFLEDGQQVISGLHAEAAFGHSIGHMMYRLNEGNEEILIWGDVANHFIFSVQYPESPVGFDDDQEQAIKTRKRVLEMVAADKLMVSGHHMPFPSIGYVERVDDTYRWVPASYQTWL